MKRTVIIEKKRGETPLMALTAWKEANPLYKEVAASYAGRLDPMAEGKLLILLGDECKKQSRYTALDKEYEIEVLLDIGSDTGDVLGVVSYAHRDTRVDTQILKKVLAEQEGKHLLAYPAYSSKTVNGKPLFLHALEGTLGDIELPQHEEHLYRIQQLGMRQISVSELQAYVQTFLALAPTSDEPSKVLGADFRIKDVRASWQEVVAMAGERRFVILRLRVACASGAYMRTLAGRIGVALGTKALALSIKRTKIGKYWNRLWWKQW